MNEEMTNRMVEAIQSPDYSGITIQLIGILFPLIWAVWIAKKESKKTKDDLKSKNQILDERQEKLERIQFSISESINMLTKQQLDLSTTQRKVEENLRELTRLAELSRNANILNMEKSFPVFFEKYREFEKDFACLTCYESRYPGKGEELDYEDFRQLRNAYSKVENTSIRFFDSKDVPTYLYKDFENLKRVLIRNSMSSSVEWNEFFSGIYLEIKLIVNEFNQKLDQK
ncbi:hypothetical protein CI088_01350 [Enterococcus plantarum]|uniref:Uncharacterized protein n=1 Tax=Enterococcus plantarum TaxID=1077675 RepID=A0A2W4BK41_9ENTE|nr:hypothetical protein [Enterococcus plantarum]PZL77475.1 hypothetical protein CI088_01350 [Enterococcus plantarum]